MAGIKLILFFAGVKRKFSRKEADLVNLVQILDELDTRAEKRFHEREEKSMEMFLDAETERWKHQHEEDKEMRRLEQQHEERMQQMFMGFMQQSMAMFAGRYPPPAASYSQTSTLMILPRCPSPYQEESDQSYSESYNQ